MRVSRCLAFQRYTGSAWSSSAATRRYYLINDHLTQSRQRRTEDCARAIQSETCSSRMITCFSSVDVAGVCRLLLTRHRTDIIITIIMSKIIKASSSVSTIRRENLCYKGCRAILILLLIDCYLLCREANSFKIVNDHARLIGGKQNYSVFLLGIYTIFLRTTYLYGSAVRKLGNR